MANDMRAIVLIFACFFLASCQPQKNFDPTSIALTIDCAKQSTCDIQILSGKSMRTTTDNAQTTYDLEDSPSKNVVVYKYARVVKGNIQDAGYREEIVFEVDKNVREINLTDQELQNTKMLFGRFCFCKGQTGYYPVKAGTLSIDASHNGQLDFTIPEVPQVTKQIRFSLK